MRRGLHRGARAEGHSSGPVEWAIASVMRTAPTKNLVPKNADLALQPKRAVPSSPHLTSCLNEEPMVAEVATFSLERGPDLVSLPCRAGARSNDVWGFPL